MNEQQTRKMNEAAYRFAEALTESYKVAADRAVSAQINAQLTQDFFGGVIKNLRAQAKDNRELVRELTNQQQRQQETAQTLAQESTSVYMEFLESMYFFYRSSVKEAERSAEEAERSMEGPQSSAGGEAGSSAGEIGSSAGEAERNAGEAESDSREYFSNAIRETNRRSAGEA